MKNNPKQNIKQKIYWGAIISPLLGIIGSIMILITINALEYTIVLPSLTLLIFWLSPFAALGAIFLGLFGLKKISQDPLLKGKWLCIIGIILGSIILLVMYYIILQGAEEWSTTVTERPK